MKKDTIREMFLAYAKEMLKEAASNNISLAYTKEHAMAALSAASEAYKSKDLEGDALPIMEGAVKLLSIINKTETNEANKRN